jgi:TrmH family RNA methyltransferase
MNPPTVLDRIRVVLVRTSHPGNIGAAARAMLTMGLTRLYLVEPRYFPDPQADAMATGAIEVLQRARVCASLDEALAGAQFCVGTTARVRDLSAPMVDCRAAAQRAVREAATQEVALLFGAEIFGLTNEELDRCQLLLSIPTNDDFSSLNLAAAVQVVAYETRMAALQRDVARKPKAFATQEQLELLYEHAERTLYQVEFFDPQRPHRMMRRLRRLFSRTRLEENEVHILRGILTQVNKKAGGSR